MAYQIGDFVIYGSNGVCRIEAIGKLNSKGMPHDVEFYTLVPHYTKGSRIFTPVGNSKVLMRAVISREEASKLIDEIPSIEALWIADDRKREDVFKEALRSGDLNLLIRIIKTLFLRRQERISAGKKITASDEKYYHLAEESLYGELAIALGMTKPEVENYIIERCEMHG